MRRFFAFASLLVTAFSTAHAATGRLPDGVTPIHYDVSVTANAAALTFDGVETITVNVTRPTSTITLNAANLVIKGATLDRTKTATVALDATKQTVTLRFAEPVPVGEHKIGFAWTGKINQSASGLFAVDYDGAKGAKERLLVTQFEAPDARSFAPMWDEPAYKATFSLTVFQPDGQMAFSNMPVVRSQNTAGGSLVSFATTPKMSSYLLFFGVGNMERKTKMAGNVEVGIITRKGVVDQGDYSLDAAVKLIAYYNDYFGKPYPLPKLDMIAAPGSSQFFGAMENWGAILYFERTVLIDPALVTESQRQDVFATVAHEIAHQWFGNLVTMAWWDDLWLNEGFASWMEGKVSNDLNPNWQIKAQQVAGGRQGAMNLDARATTHPIVTKIETVDQISQAFDTITYQKGEAVIGMLEASIGTDPFRAGVRNYMAKHAYSNTVTGQLWSELAKTSGKPVAAMMQSFTTQGGVPLIRVGAPTCSKGTTRFSLSQGRFGLDAPSRQPQSWQVPVTVNLAGGAAASTTSVTVSGAKPVMTSLNGCGLAVVNFGQTGYFRTLYTPAHFAALKAGFSSLSVEDQVGLLSDTLALANGDNLSIDQHLGLLSAIPQDSSPLVWAIAANQLLGLDDRMTGTADQSAYRAKAAALLLPVFAKVGWEAKSGEATTVAQLRERLLPAMAQFGDAGIVAEAKRYVDLSFSNPAAVPGPIRLVALSAYARNLDSVGWDALHARAKAETGPVAKRLYYLALASAVDPRLAQRALDIALTDETPVPLRSSIIDRASDEHPDMVFDWAVQHKDKVDALLEASSKSEFIVGLASGSSSLAIAKKVTDYAAANIPADARAPARQTVAFITYRAGRVAKQTPAIARWAKAK
jgi:aminopeptidase N